MKHTIYPCLWFDNNASAAAAFYCAVFPSSAILQENPIVSTFTLNGTKFMGLNGGPKYKVSPAVSYYVYCGNENEIDRIYKLLSENGTVMMPLDKYDWSEKYAWVMDRFGVNWQLDIHDIKSTQKIVPALLFANEKYTRVKEAVANYTNIFSGSKILLEAPYPQQAGLPEGTLLFAQFILNDFVFNAMSSTIKHEFDFTPGNSFVIECVDQQEIDHFWDRLGNGGRYDMCGWLADKYGVSWQVIPSILPSLMADPVKGPAVIQAFLKMKKFEIAALLNA